MKIKNLIVHNFSKIASVACLIGIEAIILATAKNSNSHDGTMTKFSPDTIIFDKFVEREIKIETVEPIAMTFNFGDMVARADEDIVRLEEEHRQEYLDNLIASYETGYDVVNDVEVDNETFELTFDNETYEHLPVEDFATFVAVVNGECSGDTHDALATATSMLNRCVSENWINWLNNCGRDGTNPIDQITMSGQYNIYENGTYVAYLDFNVSQEVFDACYAAWYLGIRNHNFCCFRSNGSVGYSDNQVVDGGNRYAGEIVDQKEKTLV